MIKIFRVDTRLIHGQIVEGWMKFYRIDEILIIDDYIFASDFELKILRFSVPENVDFEVLNSSQAAERWEVISKSSKRILVLVQNIEILKKLHALGVRLPQVNLGLVNYADSRLPVSRSVYLNEAERRILKELLAAGVDFFIQPLPTDEKISLGDVIDA
ncbi:MAG: PTS sugar transporter subunit IIB [Elusimicrobia bacterium]|nr:PTS sugar transporter subunit IIB [Elusimicrobiota bacterium]